MIVGLLVEVLHLQLASNNSEVLPLPERFTSLVCEPAVDGGERAVIYDRIRGVLDEPVGEGTHFRVPWLQSPNVMDIRTRPRTISSVTGTKGAISSPNAYSIQAALSCK